MDNPQTKLIVGIGCDKNTSLKTLEAALSLALATIAANHSQIVSLATIDKKSLEAGLLQLADKYHWRLQFFSAERLAKVTVPSPSAVVQKYMGTPSVAEAAAILAASSCQQHLLVEKYKHQGEDGKNATISILKI